MVPLLVLQLRVLFLSVLLEVVLALVLIMVVGRTRTVGCPGAKESVSVGFEGLALHPESKRPNLLFVMMRRARAILLLRRLLVESLDFCFGIFAII